MPRTLAALLFLTFAAGAEAAALPVVVVPQLELESLSGRGAVGLLVPGAGPETSAALARAALVRGEVQNSLRDGPPPGPPLIAPRASAEVPDGPAIVLALPAGGEQPNDRRYPVAVLAPGYRGLLVSDSTRLPGLVSIADIAPTALGHGDALRSQPAAEPLAKLRALDERIDANSDVRPIAGWLAAGLLALLALALPGAGPIAVVALLAANLVLGAAGVSNLWIVLVVLLGSALLVALSLRGRLAAGLAAVAVLAAYLVAMGIDAGWVALSPLGPTQNARFYGLSNLLETILLVPALVGAWVLARRLAPAALAVVALLALLMVAGSRFGADGGGAIVLATGYAVLAAGLYPRGRLLAVAAVAAGVAALLVADALLGVSTHVTRSLADGPGGLASDLADRVSLSWARATAGWAVALAIAAGIAALAVLVARLPRLAVPSEVKTLLAAFAAAIAVSLLVNDSPLEVAVWGAVGYFVVERFAAREASWPQLNLGSTLPRS